MKQTKIHIVSGFLGAGKTTLLRKILQDGFPNQKVVLIENEFGDVNIDAKFLSDTGIAITELTAGCICCSLHMKFEQALLQIVETYHPDCIFIEPTGVAKMQEVEKAIAATHLPNLSMETVTTVVCGCLCSDYLEGYGDFYEDQIAKANCILVNQMEEMTRTEQAEVLAKIRHINPTATLVTTPWTELSTAEIWQAMTQKKLQKNGTTCTCGQHHTHDACTHHHHHHAESPFQSITVETAATYTQEDLRTLVASLAESTCGEVLRIKGMVPDGTGHWIYFDTTPVTQSFREGVAQLTGTIAVIGCHLQAEKVQHLLQGGDAVC